MACSNCASDCRCAVISGDTVVTVTGTGAASNPYRVSIDLCTGLAAIYGVNRDLDFATDRVVAINGSGACELIRVAGGPTGDPGATGPAGAGVPTGGSTSQYLVKDSGTDYDTSWATMPTYLLASNNLSDLVSASTARTNLASSMAVCTSGTRPSSPYAGMFITETDTGYVYRRNNANTAWDVYSSPSVSFTATFSSTGTPPALGTGGSSTGSYKIVAGECIGWVDTRWGTAAITVGTGNYTWQLPISPVAGRNTFLSGFARITDSGTGISTNAQALISDTGQLTLKFPKPAAFASSGIGVDTNVSATEPVVPTVNDRYEIRFSYPVI